jgi:integrase
MLPWEIVVKAALTDRAIKAAKPKARPYDKHDAVVPGLALNVLPSGIKRFVLIKRFPGGKHPTRRALGAYGALSLEGARNKTRAWLELIGKGVDPANEDARLRREADARRAITFAAVVEDYIRAAVLGSGKRPNHRTADETIRTLREVLVPLFGHRPITELTALEMLAPIKTIAEIGTDRALVRLGVRKALRRPGHKPRSTPSQAHGLFALLRMVFNWASDPQMHYGLDRSPLDRVRLDRQGLAAPAPRKHTLNDEELAALQMAIARLDPPRRQMYQVVLLSGLRIEEVAGACWTEIQDDVWIIPAERMKGKNSQARAHLVPITTALRKVFDGTPKGPHGDFIFSRDGGATSAVIRNSALKQRLDRLMLDALRRRAMLRGEDPAKVRLRPFRNHDIRRSCRTTLSRLGVSFDVAEAVLAHVIGGVAGRYDLWDRCPEKRDALERWAKFLAGLGGPRLAKVAQAG